MLGSPNFSRHAIQCYTVAICHDETGMKLKQMPIGRHTNCTIVLHIYFQGLINVLLTMWQPEPLHHSLFCANLSRRLSDPHVYTNATF